MKYPCIFLLVSSFMISCAEVEINSEISKNNTPTYIDLELEYEVINNSFTFLPQPPPPPPPPSFLDSEEYDKYIIKYKSEIDTSNYYIYVFDTLISLNKSDELLALTDSSFIELDSIDFNLLNSRTLEKDSISSSFNTKVFNIEKNVRLKFVSISEKPKYLRAKNDNYRGSIQFSRALFNKTKTKAIIYVMPINDFCGIGYNLHKVSLVNGKWEIIESQYSPDQFITY